MKSGAIDSSTRPHVVYDTPQIAGRHAATFRGVGGVSQRLRVSTMVQPNAIGNKAF